MHLWGYVTHYVTYRAKPSNFNNYFHQYIALNGTSRMRLAELPCHSDVKPPRLTWRLKSASQPRQQNGGGLRCYLRRHTLC
jgi:hypothetical protein